MRYRLMDILCCPECFAPFRLSIFRSEVLDFENKSLENPRCKNWCAFKESDPKKIAGNECIICYQTDINEGKLICHSCNIAFPIVNCVPRILPQDLLNECMTTYYPDFSMQYGHEFPSLSRQNLWSDTRKINTFRAFGYQWTTFVKNFDYFKDLFLSFVHPFLKPEDFQDKLVLEVGCGSGRPASVAASFGAEVVAVDLSEAVQTANTLTATFPYLHVIQCDAYWLPFKQCFDFVYSVGVMQHLPDPASGFKSISKVIAPGHPLIVWVYGKREAWYWPVDFFRNFTTKLSFRTLRLLSLLFAFISELLFLIPYRIFSRIPVMRKVADNIPGRIYANLPFKENVLGWFDRLGAPVTYYFSRNELKNMLYDAGFRKISIKQRLNASNSWVARGIKPKKDD